MLAALDEDEAILKPQDDQLAIRGSLCFFGNKIPDPFTIERFNVASSEDYESLYAPSFEGRCASSIKFAVDSARIVSKDGQKFVVIYQAYNILLSSSRFKDVTGNIERRYTDFCYLHAALKKQNFITLAEIPFPERILLGNFQYSNIYKRSRSFEIYLRQLSNVSEIANSTTFLHFLHRPEASQCRAHLLQRNYPACAPALRNLANIQTILFKSDDPKIITTTATLCVVSSLIKDYKDSWASAIQALKLLIAPRSDQPTNKQNVFFNTSTSSAQLGFDCLLGENGKSIVKELIAKEPLFLPLIHMISDLAWVMGHDKEPAQNVLNEVRIMEEQGIIKAHNVDQRADILKCFITQTAEYLSLV